MSTGLWLDLTRNSMQRLGYMKVLVHLIPTDRGIESNLLINKFFNTVTTKVNVDITQYPDLCRSLIDKKLLSFRYKYLDRTVIENVINNEQLTDSFQASLEFQDLYLSDYDLPSITGAITHDVQGEPLNLATQIGLLKENNHNLLSLGNLLKMRSPDLLKSFKEYNKSTNPFLLTLADKVILLYAILSNDMEVFMRVLRTAIEMNSFDRGEIGDRIPRILQEIIKLYQPKAVTQTDKKRITRLKEISKSVEKMIGKPSGGTGRAREQFITPRLEHLVEFGFLEKITKYGYEYSVSNHILDLKEYISILETDNNKLNEIFISLVNLLNRCNAVKLESQYEIIEAIKEHSNLLKDVVGYSPIIETIILSNITLLEKGLYFEISDGIMALEGYQVKNPKKLRFNIDRSGKISYFKIME